ncbi:unnamed protein product [Prorocentrum cordatum]|uniref:AB hydrolase-1 domain-containing protein n=1 Tax=Prorocentrum cordatum TaxID=2364126 RepID=A0ABN9YFH2_9DINO|nr:unnamed protein product [Polarella glacialis]
MWRKCRARFWQIVDFTGGGREGESDDEGDSSAERGTPYCTIIAAGLAVGTVGSLMLGDDLAGGEKAANASEVLRPLDGVGAGLCASLVLSGCLGALPPCEAEPGRAPRSRLAAARRQVVADLTAYESNVRVTLLAGAAVAGLHAACSARPGWLAAARGWFAAALAFPVFAVQGSGTLLFELCVILPVAAAAGALRECLVGLLVGAALCARFWIRFLQDRFLYHPRRYDALPLWDQAYEFGGQMCTMEKVSYAIRRPILGSFEQSAFLLRPESGVSVLWVVHGGNAMLATDWLSILDGVLRQIPPIGIGFLLVDYPGRYGLNAGRPSPGAALAASQAAVAAALAALQEAPRVCLLGHSLGCAASAQLAASLIPPAHMVISAPFSDIPTMEGAGRPAARAAAALLPARAALAGAPPVAQPRPGAGGRQGRLARQHHPWPEGRVGAFLHGSDAAPPGGRGRLRRRKTVEAHSLAAGAALNGARGRVESVQGERVVVRFGADEPKAVRQENVRIVDAPLEGRGGGSRSAPRLPRRGGRRGAQRRVAEGGACARGVLPGVGRRRRASVTLGAPRSRAESAAPLPVVKSVQSSEKLCTHADLILVHTSSSGRQFLPR